MSTKKRKQKSSESKESFVKYSNDPVMIRKRKELRRVISKYGLPENILKRVREDFPNWPEE